MTNPTPQQIKQARLDANLKQREASELVGLSIKTWQSYEGGWRNIRPATWKLFNLLTGAQNEKTE